MKLQFHWRCQHYWKETFAGIHWIYTIWPPPWLIYWLRWKFFIILEKEKNQNHMSLFCLSFVVDLLYFLRIYRILFNIATSGMVKILYVFGSLFTCFICWTKYWFCDWCYNECTKWSIFGISNFRNISPMFRILCTIWCHSNLFALDNIPVKCSVWIRRNCIGNILIWSRKIPM